MLDCRLEPLSECNLDLILNWRNHPSVRKNMYSKHEISEAEHLFWFEGLSGDEYRQYFVFYRGIQPSGVIGFSDINKVKGVASWAFYAAPNSLRGTGALMEYFALEYAFNVLSLHKLRCEVINFNTSVIKMHKRFGFVVEGQHRDAYYDDGSYYDIIHFGIFSNEWNSKKAELKKVLRLS